MGKVTAFPECAVPTVEPNQSLIEVLEQTLEAAKDGRLQSFVGTGFCSDSYRYTVWCDTHIDRYQMMGALEFLKLEWLARQEDR